MMGQNLIALLAGLGLALVLVGFAYQRIGVWRDRRRFANSGRWVDIRAGETRYLVEKGAEGPTVVFESGIGATHLNWYRVQNAVSVFASTVSYDRAGLGWSSPCKSSRTPGHVADELHAMLQAAGLRPPYVLVGHSFGGFVMRRFAALHSDEVVGVILVDSMRCEEWPPINEPRQATVNLALRLCGFAIPIARVGLARLAVTSLLCRSGRVAGWLTQIGGKRAQHVMGRLQQEIGKMPRETWPLIAAHWSGPAFFEGMLAHLQTVRESVREMMDADPIQGLPIVVLTPDSSRPLSDADLCQIGARAQQVVVPGSAHWIHLDQPQAVVAAIRAMVDSVTVRAEEDLTVSRPRRMSSTDQLSCP